MEIKIKMTKQMYKIWDSYNRRERWMGRNLLNALKVMYGMD